MEEQARIMSRHFKGKEIHVANTHLERSSKSFSFKEIEIKAAIRLIKYEV